METQPLPMYDVETEPLLWRNTSAPAPPPPSLNEHTEWLESVRQDREIKNDVLLENSTNGRNIGWASAYILVISRVIGSGVFAMPGTIIQGVGSPGLALTLWIIGALVAWAELAIAMEYGCMLPRSGGVKVYLEYTYRRPKFLASTLVAVQAVLLGFTATNCIVFAKYILFATHREPTDLTTKALAAGLLLAITIVHGCFYKAGIWIQNLLGWLKVALISFMIVTGFFAIFFRSNMNQIRSAHPSSRAWGDLWTGSDWAWNSVSTAFFKIFYSYAGLSNVNNVLNEVKDPVRTIKTVGPAALITACTMYVLINVAYLAVIPLENIKEGREMIAALFFERIFGPGFGNVFLPIVVALSAAGNVMVVTFSLARVNQEVARQGFLPYSELLASSRPFNAPMGGLIVHFIPSLLVIVLPPSSSVYMFIADIEGYAGQFFAVAVSLGLIWLRFKKPHLHRPFKAWLPAVGLRTILCVCLIFAPFFPSKQGNNDVSFFYATYALVAIAILTFGVIYWYIWTRALPRLGGYKLREEADILADGTTVTRLVRDKQD